MIEFIKGTLDFVTPEYIVIETGGIGYKIICANNFSFQRSIHERVQVYTYHYVREDQMSLYGFHTREERTLFEKLIQVSGIGPKGALAILASGNDEQIVAAIEEENEKFLMKFPGVGKKTARQMILDLKGKLSDVAPNLFHLPDEEVDLAPKENQALHEALEALKVLGYNEKEIQKIKGPLEKETGTTDEYLKRALQLLLK